MHDEDKSPPAVQPMVGDISIQDQTATSADTGDSEQIDSSENAGIGTQSGA